MDWFHNTHGFIISACFQIGNSSYMVQAIIPNSACFYLQNQTGKLGRVESILLHCLWFDGSTLLSSWHDMSSWYRVYMAWLSKCEEAFLRDQETVTALSPPVLHSSSQQLQALVAGSLKAGERQGSCGQFAVLKGQCEFIRTGDIRQQKCFCFSLG